MRARKQPAPANLLNDYHLLSFDSLDSTNEEARRLAKGGGRHGAVIWAKRQTAGKGRMGREWVSPEGNLFVSILLNPEKPLEVLGQLSFVAAVAAIDALAGMPPEDAKLECKWPNDILLKGRKLGGILLESFQENGKQWVIVGVGINVDNCPENTAFPATCLKEAGVELVSAKIILSRFIHHFIERYNEWNRKGFGFVRKAWVMAAWGLNRRLRVGDIEGACEGIDAKGSLLLRCDDGNRREIHAGDVTPVEAMQPCS
ncbi:MAG: biotin--[acetyl-CoA-carboxylase] ligase [Pseudomonadota bacterium]|nr:biotin--[acetyl-CoA-carboxylase] ligase [Pseudomonadota bacterium]MDE3038169.1 biotin--[acetyl-CoA-carboxylase] ligase [Pseudomonadota bacterium]